MDRGSGVNKIRELRDQKAWSVRDLADRAGIDVNSVHRRETGTIDDLTKLRAIAKALGVHTSELLPDEDIEFRPDDDVKDILRELMEVPPEDRADMLTMTREIVRIARAMAARRSAGALGGDQHQVTEFADLWNRFDHSSRSRAIELLKIAELDKPR